MPVHSGPRRAGRDPQRPGIVGRRRARLHVGEAAHGTGLQDQAQARRSFRVAWRGLRAQLGTRGRGIHIFQGSPHGGAVRPGGQDRQEEAARQRSCGVRGLGHRGTEEAANSYDFYNKLPKFEVVVPEKEKDVKPDVRGVPETRRGTYVLQAGS